eukprot:6083230-Prymnesium_polylepis.1
MDRGGGWASVGSMDDPWEDRRKQKYSTVSNAQNSGFDRFQENFPIANGQLLAGGAKKIKYM